MEILFRVVTILKRTIKILFTRNKIRDAHIYINSLKHKCGLEIGGPSPVFRYDNILPIYPFIGKLDGCSFAQETIWEGKIQQGGGLYKFDESKQPGYQYINDAVNMYSISDGKYDFVLASHVLEHIANPIKGIKEWLRVVKNEGCLLVVVPHRDGTFDHRRQVTIIDHIIEDYNKAVNEDDMSHFDEIIRHHDLSMDKPAGDIESFKKRSLCNFKNRCFHHHVFDTELAVRLFDYLKLQICAVSPVKPYHIILLMKKTADTQRIDNSKYLKRDALWRKISPFPTDKNMQGTK